LSGATLGLPFWCRFSFKNQKTIMRGAFYTIN